MQPNSSVIPTKPSYQPYFVIESDVSCKQACLTVARHTVCAGSSFLSQLPSSGLPAVTEEPAEVQDSGAANGVALTEEAVQAVAAQAAAHSSIDDVIVEALEVACAESVPAAVGTSPRRDGVEAATAAWRNRAFNAAFQGSPSLSG